MHIEFISSNKGTRHYQYRNNDDYVIGTFDLVEDSEEVRITSFVIFPASRKQGYGQKMLLKAIEEAKTIYANKILKIKVEKNNKRAIHIYTKCGFVITDSLANNIFVMTHRDDMPKELEYIKGEFVSDLLKSFPNADEQVLYFIADFLYHEGLDNAESIRNLFHNGYCYYFANMLKRAFGRGEVCIAAPFGHFVWVDTNGLPYDIEGISSTESDCFIPDSFIGDMVKDFLHIRNVQFGTTKEQIDELMKRWHEHNFKIKSVIRLDVRPFYDSEWQIVLENGDSFVLTRYDTDSESDVLSALSDCYSIEEAKQNADVRSRIFYD